MIRAIAFDFDGVLVESVDVKTRAYAYLFKEYGQDVVSKVVDYHMGNGGTSRFVKLRTIYDKILKKPLSESKLDSLSEQFSKIKVIKSLFFNLLKEKKEWRLEVPYYNLLGVYNFSFWRITSITLTNSVYIIREHPSDTSVEKVFFYTRW